MGINSMGQIIRGFWVVVLAVLLTACSVPGPGPNRHLVEQAIALQVNQTQQQLRQQLRLDQEPIDFTINHLSIRDRTPFTLEDLPTFRVRGTYNLTLQLPSHRVTQTNNPFEVFLQEQIEGKTWRVARLVADPNGDPVWQTQMLPIDAP